MKVCSTHCSYGEWWVTAFCKKKTSRKISFLSSKQPCFLCFCLFFIAQLQRATIVTIVTYLTPFEIKPTLAQPNSQGYLAATQTFIRYSVQRFDIRLKNVGYDLETTEIKVSTKSNQYQLLKRS